VNEAIQLGDEISITVVSIEGDRVKIGIDAPRSMRIFRKELVLETMNVNKEAVETAPLNLGSSLNDEIKRK
jgi:carbon storage regulator